MPESKITNTKGIVIYSRTSTKTNEKMHGNVKKEDKYNTWLHDQMNHFNDKGASLSTSPQTDPVRVQGVCTCAQ